MRGDPDYIDASCRERDRVARDKFASSRESYRVESESDAAHREGKRYERLRILDGLAYLEQETVALWQEGTPVTKAVAAYTAAVRKIVEGEG